MQARGTSSSLYGAFSLLVGLALAATNVGTAHAVARQSSTIAISDSGAFLATVNPEVDTITIFKGLDKKKPGKVAEIRVGKDPTSLAIDDAHVFVANAFDGTVSVVDIAAKAVQLTLGVGVEPSALVLSPNGTRLYVANAASNDVTVINLGTQSILTTIDVSAFGTAPRALAVTDDGDADDIDETLFVAMFYGQLRPGKTAREEGEDDQREGHVVAISTATNTVLGGTNPVVLAPLANTGFNSNGRLAPGTALVPFVASTNPQSFTTPTSAFPNQLAAIAIHPTNGHAYVVSTGASPNGPLRFNTNAQGLVSVFDLATRTEVTAAQTDPTLGRTAPLNLNRGVNLDTALVPRVFMSNPVAMAWRPNGADAWVAIQNSDVVVRLTVDGAGIPSIGAGLVAGPGQIVRIDLRNQKKPKTLSNVPRGIAIHPNGNRLFINNFISRDVTVVDITNGTTPAVLASVPATKLPKKNTIEAESHLGASLFFTGRGPDERMSSEGWGGCVVCHPNNGRSDNVTWMFDAGPRQTISLDGMFSRLNRNDQRLLNWSAVRDENQDFELNTRGVFGGRGLIDDDRLFFIFGGASGAAPADSKFIEQFNQATGNAGIGNDLLGGKKKLPKLKSPRRDFGVATLDDGSVVIIGGRAGEGAGALVTGGNAVLRFDPRTNKLTKLGSAGFTPRHSLGIGAVLTEAGQRVYAIGGYDSTDPGALPLALVQELDPATGVWRNVASLPTPIAQFGITVAGGGNTAEPLQLIHAVSGNTGSETSPSVTNPNPVQRFQPSPSGLGTWSTFDPGITLRRNHGVATGLRGAQSRVFLIGGNDAAGTVLDTVEEYQAQAVTLVSTPHTSLPAPRARFGIASTLTTNQIYVFGGRDGSGSEQATILEYTIGNNGPVAGPSGTPSGTWGTRATFPAKQGLAVASPRGVTNFLIHANGGRDARQDTIETWIARQVRAAKAPVLAIDTGALTGRTLFGTVGLVVPGFSCATCHGAEKWSRSLVDYSAPPSPEVGLGLGNERVIGAEVRQTAAQGPNVLLNVGTFLPNAPAGRTNEIRFNGADISQAVAPLGANGFNIPSLLSVHETAPYYYSGLAQTLEEVLDGSQDGNGGTRHHFVTNPADRANLIAFMRSIDDQSPVFP